MPKAAPVSTDGHLISDAMTKLFAQFPVAGIDDLIAFQRRNYEALDKVGRLAVESLNTVLHRQAATAGAVAEDSSNSLRQCLSADTAREKLVFHADLTKSAIEKSTSAFRDIFDIVSKANVEASDLLTARLTEGLAELKGTVLRT